MPANEWWGILEAYGKAVWPAQAVFFFAGLALTIFLFWSRKAMANLFMKLYLAVSFGWLSVVFFLTIGKGLAGSTFFGVLFMAMTILFVIDMLRGTMVFRLPEVAWQKGFTLGLAVIVWCYPLFSMALGRPLEKALVPGTFPCPTTALALMLLSTSLPRVDKILYILLLFWAIPFAPFIQIPRYGVYEDAIMFGMGIYALVMWVKSRKGKSLLPLSGSATADPYPASAKGLRMKLS